MELKCHIQNYAWGKLGHDSIVAKLKHTAEPTFEIDEGTHYAELWMGTHPNGPSYLKSEGIELQSWIEQNPDSLGAEVVNDFGKKLPFLLKVLSVGNCLSIQVHPSKEQAVRLHKDYPGIYKDDNHKPEMAIALSKFEALCGFRPLLEIKDFILDIPELRSLISEKSRNELSACSTSSSDGIVKNCFYDLMTRSQEQIKKSLRSVIDRIKITDNKSVTDELLLRIYSQFPDDVGCFCVYFMNYITLDQGQAIFLKAGVPHAYISGDCVECMADSDNVVRAGLTPKPKDINTLLEVTEYSSHEAGEHFVRPIQTDECSALYIVPQIKEFAVAKVVVQPGKRYDLKARKTASILILLAGEAKFGSQNWKMGQVLYLRSGETTRQIYNCSGHVACTFFQAFVNV